MFRGGTSRAVATPPEKFRSAKAGSAPVAGCQERRQLTAWVSESVAMSKKAPADVGVASADVTVAQLIHAGSSELSGRMGERSGSAW